MPYARNPRVCPEAAIAKVAASLNEFGFRQPIVVDEEGVIIAGHTRLLAAQRLGLEQVPGARRHRPHPRAGEGLPPRWTTAPAQETSWDLELLPLELSELAGFEFDLALTGFEPDELAAFLADADRGPHRPRRGARAARGAGDAGPATSTCSASTACSAATRRTPRTCERLMAGKRATLMATDPPYLVDYHGGAHPASEANGGAETKDKHWDTYIDHEHSVDFYVDFLQGGPRARPRRARRHLPVVRHHAHRGHLAELARGRPAPAPGADLEEDAVACSPTPTSCGTTSR